ncbi:MAG: RIP metalloprotease RseP [Pseudomonadota bacterium]
MLNLLISLIGIVITILLVVGIHETGHFLVAKWSNIKVLRFSIGFGKALFTWHDKSGTEYVLAAIPLGGYVKMLDEDEDNVPESEKHLAFNRQPFYKKFAVIAAGPISNFVLAFIIYWLLFVVGFVSIAPVVGNVTPHSIAEQAGIKPQQEIIQLDGKEVHSWMNIIIQLLSGVGDRFTMDMTIKDKKTVKTVNLNLTNWHMDNLRPDPLLSIGITPFEPVIPNVIGKVVSNSPAAHGGILSGDQITAINGKATNDWYALINVFMDKPNQTLMFSVKRNNKMMVLPVKIGVKRSYWLQSYGYLGMAPAFEWPKELLRVNQYGPVAALGHAWQDVAMFTNMNFMVFRKILTGKISLESLGGPITIFENAGTALNNGVMSFLSFLAFLSISIGVINILPIPGLDGGHLFFQVIELIRRKPLEERALTLFYRFGMIFLLLLMVQALVNDLMRLG